MSKEHVTDIARRLETERDTSREYPCSGRDPKASKRFRSLNTYYGSGRKCEYGDKTKVCDPSCRFWESCIKGRQRGEN